MCITFELISAFTPVCFGKYGCVVWGNCNAVSETLDKSISWEDKHLMVEFKNICTNSELSMCTLQSPQ